MPRNLKKKDNTGDIVSDSADRGKRPDGQRPEGQRPGGANPGGRRDGNAGPAKGRPAQGRPDRPDRPQRDDRPRRDDRPQRDDRPARSNDRPQRDDRPQRSFDRPARDGARPPRDDRPQRSGDRPNRDGQRPNRDGQRPNRDGQRPQRGGDEKRLWTSGGAPARGNRDAREREVPEDRDPFNTRSVREHHQAPEIPDDVSPGDLDRVARNELKTLDKENADGVAQHLVMAARLIDDDPQLAHQHAISAMRRAGRIGMVRETLAITAYAIGDYELALRELRTYRRITGRDDELPLMVDSERALGRPEKALELARSVQKSTLAVPVQVELAIAMSGARLDLGQADAALLELQIPQLDPRKAFSWSPALFDAYATVLEDLGRDAEAEEWWERAEAASDALEAVDADDEMIEVVEEELGEVELDEAELDDEALDEQNPAEDGNEPEDDTDEPASEDGGESNRSND